MEMASAVFDSIHTFRVGRRAATDASVHGPGFVRRFLIRFYVLASDPVPSLVHLFVCFLSFFRDGLQQAVCYSRGHALQIGQREAILV